MNLYNVNELREIKYDEIIKKYIIDLKTHTNLVGSACTTRNFQW